MRLLYGLMGLVAKASGRMSRFSINAIPSNWLVIGVCAFIVMVANEARRDAINNGRTPKPISTGEFLRMADTHEIHRYVAVTGEIHPEMALAIEGSSSHYDLVPMIDRATKRGFFVNVPSGVFAGQKARGVTIQGMTWGVDSTLHSDLQVAALKFQPIAMETGMELSAGQTPGNPTNSTLLMAVAGAIGGVLLLSSLMKHVVFQRTGKVAAPLATTPFSDAAPLKSSAAAEEAEEKNFALRVTGKLRLHEKCAMRFLDIPAALARLKSGETAVISHIDASPRLHGQVTQQRVGLWLLVPQPGTLRCEEGLLYHGFKPAPALRLRYADSLEKGKAATAILSFDSAATRAEVLRELQNPAAPSAKN